MRPAGRDRRGRSSAGDPGRAPRLAAVRRRAAARARSRSPGSACCMAGTLRAEATLALANGAVHRVPAARRHRHPGRPSARTAGHARRAAPGGGPRRRVPGRARVGRCGRGRSGRCDPSGLGDRRGRRGAAHLPLGVARRRRWHVAGSVALAPSSTISYYEIVGSEPSEVGPAERATPRRPPADPAAAAPATRAGTALPRSPRSSSPGSPLGRRSLRRAGRRTAPRSAARRS